MKNIIIKNNSLKKGPIIYWMQESQRTKYNFALEYSIKLANDNLVPLFVFFNYLPNFPEAQKRHFDFMLQGLIDVKKNLEKRNIEFIILKGNLEKNICKVCENASYLIWDKAYLNFQISQREKILKIINCNVIEIESNLLIPLETVSPKEEYNARTFRMKYNKLFSNYNNYYFKNKYNNSFHSMKNINNLADDILPKEKFSLDGNFIGGEEEAIKRLNFFIKNNLKNYSKSSPENSFSSRLSPYLHFGQISPTYIYNKIIRVKGFKEQKENFLEQLLIRRELSFNFVYYNKNYNKWEGITYPWAYNSLFLHKDDKREYIYTKNELENSKTHDLFWNAAQKEMVYTGFMNSYMRMYWAKKIIEWTLSPKEAYKIIIYFNNKYLYDGRDPNSYAGVAWCFGKHDRAWKERNIFGKIRYMNENGLKRKFNMDIYLKKINKLTK